MPWFGEKGMPALPFAYGYHMALTVDEFRKSSHPVTMANPATLLLGGMGVGGVMFGNFFAKKPLLSGMPKMLLSACAGVWLGYYATRAHHQVYMGKFKYCFEYALSRKDMFPMKEKPKFSDPECLKHWRPYSRA